MNKFIKPIIDEYNKAREFFDPYIHKNEYYTNIYELYYKNVFNDTALIHQYACTLYGPRDRYHIEFALFIMIREMTRMPLNHVISDYILPAFGEIPCSREFIGRLGAAIGSDFKLDIYEDEIWLKEDLEQYKYMIEHSVINRRDLVSFVLDEVSKLPAPTDIVEQIIKIWENYRFAIVHGAGGTGKTYQIVKLINFISEHMRNGKIFILAATNLAVENVREKIIKNGATKERSGGPKDREFQTLYSFAQSTTRGKKGISNKHPMFILIDEASMMNDKFGTLMHGLDDLGVDYRCLLVGDILQLPPVKSTSLWKIILDKAPREMRIDLQINYRCADLIIKNSLKLNDLPEESLFEKYYVSIREFFAIIEFNPDIFRVVGSLDDLTKEELKNSMMITYHNEDVDEYNKYVSEIVRGPIDNDGSGRKYIAGDKCMCKKNYKELGIWNNSLCIFVDYIDCKGSNSRVIVEYQNEQIELNEEDITMAYVTTIHKAQGHQEEEVIAIFDGDIFDRRLINTAITRAKKKFTIVYNNIIDD